MKKHNIVIILLCAFLLCLPGCSKEDNREYPYYFIGQIIGEHEWGGIVKVVDYGNYDFNAPEVIMHEVRLGRMYSVGDYIRVEFDGLFLETNPPQIKSAISIKTTDQK